jgi:hypothetical protein
MQDSGNLTGLSLPGNGYLLKWWCQFAGFDEMPAPVIQTGNMPAVFQAVIEQKNFAQKVANPPVISFRKVGMLN